MLRHVFLAAFLASWGLFPAATHADIVFEFENGRNNVNGGFDGTEAGDSVTISGLTLTIRGFEYPDLTGVDGTNMTPGMNITSTGTFQGDNSGFGVNNDTINATNFMAAFDSGNEQNVFNFDETLIFDFNADVTFDSIDFQGLVDATESFNVSFAGQSFDFDNDNTNGSDTAVSPFGSTVVTEGTDIRLTFNGAQGDIARIQSLEVNNVSAVPEPTSFLLVAIGGIGLLCRRKRRTGVSF